MPYIKRENRPHLDQHVLPLTTAATGWGDLNYCVTRLVYEYARTRPGFSYEDYQAAIGCLECAKMELYRRKVAEYEDQKRHENGDVY